MTFVDTGAWAGFFVSADSLHRAAVEWIERNNDPLVTSDYVLDEFVTLVKARFGARASVEAGDRLWAEEFSQVVFVTAGDIQEAWRVFRTHRDKKWSFTDCTSYVLMKRLGIIRAFAFDQHFSQMPGVRRVP